MPSSSDSDESDEEIPLAKRKGVASTDKPTPPKKKVAKLVDRPASDAVALDSDSDFDDDVATPQKPKAPPTKPSVPASQKRTLRIQACGEKQLDRHVMAARDNGPKTRVKVYSLSFRIKSDAGADALVKLETRDGSAYDLFPPYEKEQSELGESEFSGIYFSGRSSAGAADLVANDVLEDGDVHAIVVDPSGKGDNFARLVACVAALKIKYRNAALGSELYKKMLKPKDKQWKAVLAKANRCRSDLALRAAMRDYYFDHL